MRLEYLKNKFDKLKRTKRGITYINILHTLQKVERKLLDKLERNLCKLCNAQKILFFLFFMFTKMRNILGKLEIKIFYCVYKNVKQCNLASPPKYAIWDTPAFD